MAALADAELDAKITALTGTCGLSRLLGEALQRSAHGAWQPKARRPQHEPSTRPPVDR